MIRFPRSLTRSRFFVSILFSAGLMSAADVPLWPDAPPAQLREEIFGLRYAITEGRKGPEAARKFLVTAMTTTPGPEVDAYVAALTVNSGMGSEIQPIVDRPTAEGMLRRGRKGGSLYATFMLAQYYLTSRPGYGHDEKAAVRYMQEASDRGYAPAMGLLGTFRLLGLGMPADGELGDKLVRRAAALGSVHGILGAAQAHEEGRIKGSRGMVDAMEYYFLLTDFRGDLSWKKFAEYREKNVPGAVYFESLARLRFANDDGTMTPNRVRGFLATVEKSPDLEARGWLELGVAYLKARYVTADYPKALAYLERAAATGLVEAKFFIAYARANGLGMPRQLPEALAEMEKMAEAGNVRAAGYLGRIYYWDPVRAPGFKKDKAKAFTYTRMAAEGGWWFAIFHLAECYAHGIGTPANDTLAAKVYVEAHVRGAADALEKAQRHLVFVKN